MTSEATTLIAVRKRSATQRPTPAAEGDHRKRPRNRATKSCLNCFKSKRMCDRKRPCTRCTQLGLTGLCVYEVDDPDQRSDGQDDQTRLKRRVAELEGVIRELKNKPHPRWVAPEGQTTPQWTSRSQMGTPDRQPGLAPALSPRSGSPSVSGSSSSPRSAHGQIRPSTLTVDVATASSYFPPFNLPSPVSAVGSVGSRTPSYAPDTTAAGFSFEHELASLLADSCQGLVEVHEGVLESMPEHFMAGPPNTQLDMAFSDLANTHAEMQAQCACLTDPANYHALLELSLRLRRAADILSQSSHHCGGSYCHLLHRIAELDRLTTNTLGNILTPPEISSARGGASHSGRQLKGAPAQMVRTVSGPAVASRSMEAFSPWGPAGAGNGFVGEDAFMSWDPRAHVHSTGSSTPRH